MTKWETVKLGDVCNITMGTSPKGEDINTINGIPFFQGSAEFGNRYPAVAKFTTNPIRLAKKGDILFSVRAPVGDLNIANIDCCIGRGLCAIRSIDFLLQRFVEYALLFTKNKWSAINDSGSVFGCAKRNDLLNFEIPWTKDVSVLKRVVGILGALDDKIEVLREQNKTLEQMAQAVFQSWFVDFDIVRAKAAGLPAADVCKKYHITPDIYDLFPSAFSADNLPLGWKLGKIEDLCSDIQSGGTPKRNIKEYWYPPTIPWLSSGEVNFPIIIHTKEKISEEGLRNSSAKIWKKYTTVVAMYGATAGESTLLGIDVSANQACCALIPYKHTIYYVYLLAKANKNTYALAANGAAQQNLNKMKVSELEVIIPDVNILIRFQNLVSAFFEKVIENSKQIRTLEQTRDTLLPQLLGGKIDVENVSLPSVNDEDILKI